MIRHLILIRRRCLVDEEFLTRSAGQYWRSGGTVPTSPGG